MCIWYIPPAKDIYIGYVMLRMLYQVYNHQARGQGDYKPDIEQVGMTKPIYFMTSKHVYTA